jgi:hypothetical protein
MATVPGVLPEMMNSQLWDLTDSGAGLPVDSDVFTDRLKS